MKFLKLLSILLGVFFQFTTMSSSAKADEMKRAKITVEGMRSGKGHIAISIFAKKDGFPGDVKKAIHTDYVALNGERQITVELPADFTEGEYAISVMHDELSDHKMHFNFLGIPTDGFGFSANPRVFFGPPAFAKAQVHIAPTGKPVAIRMKYLL